MSMICTSLAPSLKRMATAGVAAVLMLAAPCAAWAQGETSQPEVRPAQTLKKPATDGKVLGGIKKGTDTAGRGTARAGDAALGGVNRASESASRPIRNFGEYLGRKLERGPGGNRTQTGDPTGPQGP